MSNNFPIKEIIYEPDDFFKLTSINTSENRYSFIYNDNYNITYNQYLKPSEYLSLKKKIPLKINKVRWKYSLNQIEQIILECLKEVRFESNQDPKDSFLNLLDVLDTKIKESFDWEADFREKDLSLDDKRIKNEILSEFDIESLKKEVQIMESKIRTDEAKLYPYTNFRILKDLEPVKVSIYKAEFETVPFGNYIDLSIQNYYSIELLNEINKLIRKKYSNYVYPWVYQYWKIRLEFNLQSDIGQLVSQFLEGSSVIKNLEKVYFEDILIKKKEKLQPYYDLKLDPKLLEELNNTLTSLGKEILEIVEKHLNDTLQIKEKFNDEVIQIFIQISKTANSIFELLLWTEKTKRTLTLINNSSYKENSVIENVIDRLYNEYQKVYKGNLETKTLNKLAYIFKCISEPFEHNIEQLIKNELTIELNNLFPNNLLYKYKELFTIWYSELNREQDKGFWVWNVTLEFKYSYDKISKYSNIINMYPSSKETKYQNSLWTSFDTEKFDTYIRKRIFDDKKTRLFLLEAIKWDPMKVNSINESKEYLENIVLSDLLSLERKLKEGELNKIGENLQKDLNEWWMKFLANLLVNSKILKRDKLWNLDI